MSALDSVDDEPMVDSITSNDENGESFDGFDLGSSLRKGRVVLRPWIAYLVVSKVRLAIA